ncbi:pentraxin fusion protein-like isoform X2 [Melanotaenia boesemani]|uniref:pentraxin fusion protein-like isoform X2 n=1 Tax=Melanotaenia boesemani TaxID=1250792 RepID=UPI001C04F8C3|nr:pentraxin fusion protein-like isoform X2 [Melanotaenia boesemani]
MNLLRVGRGGDPNVGSDKMRRLAILLSIISVAWTDPQGTLGKTLIFPVETDTSYAELTPRKPMNLLAFTLCMRVATELPENREISLFTYRTQDHDELNLWQESDGRLSLYLRSSKDGVFFRVPVLGALQTHLCVTWESISGATALFMDGRKSLTKIYRKNHQVAGGGRVILGQDADSFLGKFDSSQSFVGAITDVNMWDSVLSDSTIKDVSSGIISQTGSIFDWDTESPTVNGNVKIVQFQQ